MPHDKRLEADVARHARADLLFDAFSELVLVHQVPSQVREPLEAQSVPPDGDRLLLILARLLVYADNLDLVVVVLVLAQREPIPFHERCTVMVPVTMKDLVAFLVEIAVACAQCKVILPLIIDAAVPLKRVIVQTLGHNDFVKLNRFHPILHRLDLV